MVLGFGKDSTNHEEDKEDASSLEKQGRAGQTSDNNVDPARNPVNPQVISEDSFLRNSLTYGLPVGTGRASTWDRRLPPATEEFHQKLVKKHQNVITDHLKAHRERTEERESSYGKPLPTSVNNYLVGEHFGTGEGQVRPDLGKQRGRDAEEPAHHVQFHTPTVRDRAHGALNIAAGKIRMDQDISTRGKAEFKGETDDGH